MRIGPVGYACDHAAVAAAANRAAIGNPNNAFIDFLHE
jgi:hypothetical protein